MSALIYPNEPRPRAFVRSQKFVAVAKIAIWVAGLAPLFLTALAAVGLESLRLGPNPVESVLHTMGKTSLNLLLVTLAVTPFRHLTGWNQIVRVRRLLGLLSYFYLTLHVLTYIALDLRFRWDMLFEDVAMRPYIMLGAIALLGMTALAATSTRAMQRRLGSLWRKLHKLVYVIGILGVIHFQWQTKSDGEIEPWIYAAVLVFLLTYRVAKYVRRTR